MLNAEKDVLSSALYKARNEIKRLDLDNLYSFLSSLATQAALLAGFAFGALQPYDTDNDSFWNVCLQLFVIVTLGAEMYVVCNGMLVTVLGPTLALNGPKGSMERAVYLMRRERGTIFNMFGIGLLGFFGMIICLSAIYMPIGIAAVCMVISAGFAVLTITVSRRILIDFKFEEHSEVIDTVVTDVPEPWEFFENNTVKKDLKWVSYLPSITQITKINEVLIKNKFENIEVKEVILRDWVVDKKIVRPSNKLVSHTGFIISGRYIKY